MCGARRWLCSVQIHGWFMFAAFIILLPAGILTANLFSRTHARHPWWYYAHATLTGAGSLAGIIGLGIGLVLVVSTRYATIHRWIGISIIGAIVIQVGAPSCVCKHSRWHRSMRAVSCFSKLGIWLPRNYQSAEFYTE